VKIIPAIDLLGGNVVRLTEGRRDLSTVYSATPWTIAADLARHGAERIHVVDLDGAFDGSSAQGPILRRLAAEAGVPIQVGGGVRDRATCERLFSEGIHSLVLGTVAVTNPTLLAELCRDYPGRIIVAVDARDGEVAIKGWEEKTDLDAERVARGAVDAGAAAILYTDIARDGTRKGPNVPSTQRLTELLAPTPVIASGGVGSLEDIRALRAAGVPLCIVGRALYEGTFSLADAMAAAR
jgi:phosphoribosylformimino-5-aminoimidazole carboxamide ribotide isomerase